MRPGARAMLEQQRHLYGRLAELVGRQEKALAARDISGLLAVIQEKQQLFEELQRNDASLRSAVAAAPADAGLKPAIEELAGALRELLEREAASLSALKSLKDEAIRAAAEMQRSRRVFEAYRKSAGDERRPAAPEARFVDEDT